MLTEIVEARKLLSTMTSERTFASMLPVGGEGGWLDGEWKEWDGWDDGARDGTRNERRKGKEHGPNVPGQVFAPAKNHATIAITTTLERFCRRGTIAPVNTRTVLLLRLGLDVILWEDEGSGDVSVRGIRGRGVHSLLFCSCRVGEKEAREGVKEAL
jgi:hypothetical protein